MILDRFENAYRYENLNKAIAFAFDYIRNNDLTQIATGKYNLMGDDVVLLMNEYVAQNSERNKMEAHRNYIDLQYWISGEENMGHTFLSDQPVLEAYNPATDCIFHHAEPILLDFKPGYFALFFPTDLHNSIANERYKQPIKKAVFKIRVPA